MNPAARGSGLGNFPLCACGCGGVRIKRPGVSEAHFNRNRYLKGHHYGKPEVVAKVSEGLKKAHARGAFDEGCRKRKEKTIGTRPKCKCGCGKSVNRSGALYAPRCYDGTTPENLAKARLARDWKVLSPKMSTKMSEQITTWKETGKLEEMRRKAGLDKGRPDHLAAKQWHIRSPQGLIYKFSNLAEWARRHQGLFVDDRLESKAPFWLRIAGGITDLLKENGRSCSYRGWVAVSKSELVNGAPDLLGRDVSVQN